MKFRAKFLFCFFISINFSHKLCSVLQDAFPKDIVTGSVNDLISTFFNDFFPLILNDKTSKFKTKYDGFIGNISWVKQQAQVILTAKNGISILNLNDTSGNYSYPNTQNSYRAFLSPDGFKAIAFNQTKDKKNYLAPIIFDLSNDSLSQISFDEVEFEESHVEYDQSSYVFWNPLKQTILHKSMLGTLTVWDYKGKFIEKLKEYGSSVYHLSISPDGETVLITLANGIIELSYLAKNEIQKKFSGHEAAVYLSAWHPNGKIFASASKDMTIRIWDVKTGECIYVIRDSENRAFDFTGLAFSNDGKKLAILKSNGIVEIRETDSYRLIVVYEGEINKGGGLYWNKKSDKIAVKYYSSYNHSSQNLSLYSSVIDLVCLSEKEICNYLDYSLSVDQALFILYIAHNAKYFRGNSISLEALAALNLNVTKKELEDIAFTFAPKIFNSIKFRFNITE